MHVLQESWKGGRNLGQSDPHVTWTLLLKFIKYSVSSMVPTATTCKVFCISSVNYTTYHGPLQCFCDRLSRRALCYTVDQYSDKSFQKSGPTCLEMADTAHSDVTCIQASTYYQPDTRTDHMYHRSLGNHSILQHIQSSKHIASFYKGGPAWVASRDSTLISNADCVFVTRLGHISCQCRVHTYHARQHGCHPRWSTLHPKLCAANSATNDKRI